MIKCWSVGLHCIGVYTVLNYICLHRCIKDLKKKDYNSAYESQSIVVQTLTRTFQNLKDENWLLPVINTVCLDLRMLATRLMAQPGVGTKPLEKAAECLMACFRICTADKSVFLHLILLYHRDIFMRVGILYTLFCLKVR